MLKYFFSRFFKYHFKDERALLQFLKQRTEGSTIEAGTFSMIEGVLQISGLQIRDIMVPKVQMVVIHVQDKLEDILPKVTASSHSRFPVFSEDGEAVKGILLAKDLLGQLDRKKTSFDLEKLMRPVTFVPESRRLVSLLKDFQIHYRHLAMVVDEYGAVSGLVTMEDIIEQIVGDIEDEHYVPGDQVHIKALQSGGHLVQAVAPIEAINKKFGFKLDASDFDTIGGYVAKEFGYMPKRGETLLLGGYQFKVLQATRRCIHSFQVTKQ